MERYGQRRHWSSHHIIPRTSQIFLGAGTHVWTVSTLGRIQHMFCRLHNSMFILFLQPAFILSWHAEAALNEKFVQHINNIWSPLLFPLDHMMYVSVVIVIIFLFQVILWLISYTAVLVKFGSGESSCDTVHMVNETVKT